MWGNTLFRWTKKLKPQDRYNGMLQRQHKHNQESDSLILVLCVNKLWCFVVANCCEGVICVKVCQLLSECCLRPFLKLNSTLDFLSHWKRRLAECDRIEFWMSFEHRGHSNILVFSEKDATLYDCDGNYQIVFWLIASNVWCNFRKCKRIWFRSAPN